MGDGHVDMVIACNLFSFELHVRTYKLENKILFQNLYEISLQTTGVDINHNASNVRITPIVNNAQHSLLIA
jgi:hypothetical protein